MRKVIKLIIKSKDKVFVEFTWKEIQYDFGEFSILTFEDINDGIHLYETYMDFIKRGYCNVEYYKEVDAFVSQTILPTSQSFLTFLWYQAKFYPYERSLIGYYE